MWWFLKQRSRAARWSYGRVIILGFGLQDGLWNHTVKMTVLFLSAPIEPRWRGCRSPVDSAFHEVNGVLTFVAAIFAANFGYQFMSRTRQAWARAPASRQGAAMTGSWAQRGP
jgi:hypothetical protein